MTGIGGGVVRDMLLGETPVVLRRNLRAVPALLGGTIVSIAHAAGSDNGIFAITGGAACLALWAVGSRFGLELPTIRPDRGQHNCRPIARSPAEWRPRARRRLSREGPELNRLCDTPLTSLGGFVQGARPSHGDLQLKQKTHIRKPAL